MPNRNSSYSPNRRAFTRVPFCMAVRISTAEQTWDAAVSDLSIGGLLVSGLPTDELLVDDGTCRVEFVDASPSTLEPLAATARIVRRHEGRIGLCFDTMPIEVGAFLRNVVNYNTGRPELVALELERHLAAASAGQNRTEPLCM
ncbi:MAG: PilZ domain-containing protein [Planctomycetota bacterium]